MKQQMNFGRISRTVFLAGLILFACSAFVGAQVIPTVCFEPKPETFTRTLTVQAGVAFGVTQTTPGGYYRIVINPGGATEESRSYSRIVNGTTLLLRDDGVPTQPLVHPHFNGETVVLTTDGDAAFGYNNTSSAAVTIPRGVGSTNYFQFGQLIYTGQPSVFQPGRRENVVVFKAVSDTNVTWFLNGRQAKFNAEQVCATITYQGRLSDQNAAANGQYDLQFQAFDAETDGTSQSGPITVDNVQVTNGVFTVPLKFGSALSNNFNTRFLEIGVRPGAGTGSDPFTVLTPRQPITSVPYAVNAQNATTATNATQLGSVEANQYVLTTDPRLSAMNNGNFIQNSTAQQTGNFNINGSGTIGGNLTVNGTINGTVTNATNATNAVNATNAAQLGGAAANQYFRSAGGIVSGNLQANGDIAVGNNLFVTGNTATSGNLTVGGTLNANFGQSVTTALGTAILTADATTGTYTLVPGLTQTVTVPANSSLVISTDGGINSLGALNTFSVIDVAIFVDGTAISQRRIVIGNFPLAASVGNWALSNGQTLSAGSHTIEVRSRTGVGGSSNAIVSSGNDPLLRGQLTVTIVKK